MRRSFALALTALLLVFTLTACGNRANDSTQTPSASQNETSDSTQSDAGGSGSESGSSGNMSGDSGGAANGSGGAANGSGGSQSDQNTTAGDTAGDLMDGMENAVDDVLPDGNANTRQRGTGGVPYGDMMHNDRR